MGARSQVVGSSSRVIRHHHGLVAFAAVDCFVFGQGLIIAGLGLLAVVHLVWAAVERARGRRERVGDRIVRAVQCAFVCAGAFVILRVQNAIAEERAEQIVHTIERHHARTERWPRSLEALGLPTAAQPFRLMGGFRYSPTADGRPPLLLYAVLPPFGRRVYSFERRSWGTLD